MVSRKKARSGTVVGLVLDKLFGRLLCGCLLVFLHGGVLGVAPDFAWGADPSGRLAAGEIITDFEEVPGSNLKKGRVVGVVAAPPEKVWEVVTDANNFQFFMPRMLRSRLLGPEEVKRILQAQPNSADAVEAGFGSAQAPEVAQFRVPGRKYQGHFFGQVKVPWPLGNRWYIVKLQYDESQAARHTYRCSWSLVTGNLKENRGEWKVEPFGEDKTRLTYRVVTDPGGLVPKFIVEKFTAQTLPQIIIGVRNRLASRR